MKRLFRRPDLFVISQLALAAAGRTLPSLALLAWTATTGLGTAGSVLLEFQHSQAVQGFCSGVAADMTLSPKGHGRANSIWIHGHLLLLASGIWAIGRVTLWRVSMPVDPPLAGAFFVLSMLGASRSVESLKYSQAADTRSLSGLVLLYVALAVLGVGYITFVHVSALRFASILLCFAAIELITLIWLPRHAGVRRQKLPVGKIRIVSAVATGVSGSSTQFGLAALTGAITRVSASTGAAAQVVVILRAPLLMLVSAIALRDLAEARRTGRRDAVARSLRLARAFAAYGGVAGLLVFTLDRTGHGTAVFPLSVVALALLSGSLSFSGYALVGLNRQVHLAGVSIAALAGYYVCAEFIATARTALLLPILLVGVHACVVLSLLWDRSGRPLLWARPVEEREP